MGVPWATTATTKVPMPTTDRLAPLRLDVHPRRAVEVTFDAPHVSSDGGLVLLRQLDERLGLCEQVAALVPDNAFVRFQDAELHWERGETQAALDGYRHTLQLEPDSRDARRNLALLVKQGRPPA